MATQVTVGRTSCSRRAQDRGRQKHINSFPTQDPYLWLGWNTWAICRSRSVERLPLTTLAGPNRKGAPWLCWWPGCMATRPSITSCAYVAQLIGCAGLEDRPFAAPSLCQLSARECLSSRMSFEKDSFPCNKITKNPWISLHSELHMSKCVALSTDC